MRAQHAPASRAPPGGRRTTCRPRRRSAGRRLRAPPPGGVSASGAGASTMTSPARLGRSACVLGVAHLEAARGAASAMKRRERAPPRPAAGPRPRRSAASKRSATTDGSSGRPGRRVDRLVGAAGRPRSKAWISSAKARFTKRRIAGRERKFWVRCSTALPGRLRARRAETPRNSATSARRKR